VPGPGAVRSLGRFEFIFGWRTVRTGKGLRTTFSVTLPEAWSQAAAAWVAMTIRSMV